jgi:hypothetical protein
LFNNDYYDFEKLDFIDNFDNIDTNIKIDMDFPKKNDSVIYELYEKVLKPILGPD